MPSFLRPLGDNAGQPLTLRKRTTSLGRAEDNDVQALPRSVSGYHAEVELLDGGGAVLHDRGADGSGSRFGSFVGDDHFTGGWREVCHGDIIRLGTLQHGVAFRYEESEGAPLPPPPRPEQFITEPETLQNAAKRALRERNTSPKERPVKDEVPAAGRRSRTDVPVSVSYQVADGIRVDDQNNNLIGRSRVNTSYDDDMPLREQKRQELEKERLRLEEEKRQRDNENKLAQLREKRRPVNESLSPRGAEPLKHSLRYDDLEDEAPERPSQVQEVDDAPFSPPLPDPPSLPSLAERFESPRLPAVVHHGSVLLVEEEQPPALPPKEQNAVLEARERAAASMRRLNQALAGVRPFSDLQSDLEAPGPAPAAGDEIEELRGKVAQLTHGMTDESRLELKALQEQISALAPKVDGLVAKEGTGEDVQERMESLREELCAALRDDVRNMLKKEKARVEEDEPSTAAQLREMKASMDRDRKERRRERKRDDHNALKEKVNEVLLRQQIGGGGARPMLATNQANLEELQANLEQPMIDLLQRLDSLQNDVKSLKDGSQKTQKVSELSAYKKAVQALASKAPSSAPNQELIHRMRALEEEVRLLREEDLSPPTPYRTAVVEAPAPRFQPDTAFSPAKPRRSLRGVARGLGAFGRRSQAGDDYRRDLAAVRREVDAAHERIAQVDPQAFERMKSDLEKSHREAERRHDALLKALTANQPIDVSGLNAGVQKAHERAVDHLQNIPGVSVEDVDAVKKVLETGTARAEQRHENLYAYQAPVPAPSMTTVLKDPVANGEAATSYWSKLRANVRLGKASGTEVRLELQKQRAELNKRLESDNDPHLQILDEELRKTEQAAVATPTKRATLQLAFDACDGVDVEAYKGALTEALRDPATDINEVRQQVETLDDPVLREMVRAPSIAQDRRRSLCAALKADLRDDDDASRRRAARGLKLYVKEAHEQLVDAPPELRAKIRTEITSLIEVATGDIREGLTLLMEDCSEAAAPAAAPESRRLDALADLQTEMAAVANGADASKIKRKFRAYAKRARLAHRDEVEQELAQIKKQVAQCAEAEAPVAAISAALDEFDAIAEAPAPALERETTYAKVFDDLETLRREVSSKTRSDEAVSEAVRALESRLQTYFVSLRADDVQPERDESELEALRVQVRELKAARTLAKFGFGKKRKPTKAKEDAKTLDALDAKIQAVQTELRSARPVVEAPAPPPSVVEEPAAPPLLSPVRRVLSAALQPPARAAGPADDASSVNKSDGLKSALLAQAQALSQLTNEIRQDRSQKRGSLQERPRKQAWGDPVPDDDLRELEDQCLRLLDEDYGTSTEQPLSSLVEALRALRAVPDRTKARAELRLLRQRSEELRRVSTGIEQYDHLCSQVDAFVDQIRKSIKRPVPAIRFSQDDLTPPHSPSRRRSFETSPPQSPTRSELSVTFRDDRFRQDRSERQQRLTEDIEGQARLLLEEIAHIREDNCATAIDVLRGLHDLVDQLKAPHSLRDLAAQLRDHADFIREELQHSSSSEDDLYREGLRTLENLVIQQLRSLQATPSPSERALHQQLKQHQGNLTEAMGYLRESTARDTAADELRALNSKVGVLAHSHSETSERTVRAVDAALAKHAERLERAQVPLNDVHSRRELDDLRHLVDAARSNVGEATERQISRHAQALREEMAQTIRNARHKEKVQNELKELKAQVSALQMNPRDASTLLRDFKKQLSDHVEQIADKLARTQNQETRGHLHEVRSELKSVQALASTNSLEQSIARHASQLRSELNQNNAREAADEVRLLKDRLSKVDAVPSTLEVQLREHYQQVSEALRRNHDGDLQQLKVELKELREQLRKPADDSRINALENRMEAHATALRDDFRRLREDGVSQRTQLEIQGLRDTCAELSSYRKEMPDTLRRELQQHSEVIKGQSEFGELRKELQAVRELCGSTQRSLEAAIQQHAVALRDEMRHLRESSGARDRAGDELRALRDKVRETTNDDVVRNLERQLAQHASRVERAQENADREVKSELKALGERIEAVRTAAQTKESLQQNVEANAQLLREELRSLKVNDETLNALKSQVEELKHRGEHDLVERLSSELGSHTQQLKEAILSGQGGSELRDLQRQLLDLREASKRDLELFIAQTPKKEDISSLIEEKTSALKEDITRMRDSFARDAASSEVRALNDTVRDLKRSSEARSSTEDLRLQQLEERLREADSSHAVQDASVSKQLDQLREDVRRQLSARRDESVEAKLAEHATRLREELHHALSGASNNTSTELKSLAAKIASLESGGDKVASALSNLEKQLSGHARSLQDTDLTTLRREVESVRNEAATKLQEDKFQTLQRQIDGNSAQAQFLETQKQLNDVKERFAAKDQSIEKLSKELSELRRVKEAEAQAAQRAEKLALEQSVKQRDAEIESLRKQLSEDDLSTPRDRGALFALRRQLARASRRDARRLRRDLEDLRRVRAADARAARDALNEIARSLSGAPAPAPSLRKDLAELREAQKRDADISRRAIDQIERHLDGTAVAEAPAPADLDSIARQGDRAFENANLDAVRRRLRELAEAAQRGSMRADRLERDALRRLSDKAENSELLDAVLDQVQTLNQAVFPEETPRTDEDTPRTDALRRLTSIGRRDELADLRREVERLKQTSVIGDDIAAATRDDTDPERDRALIRSLRRQLVRSDAERDRAVRSLARNAKGADAVNGYAEKQREALTKAEHEVDVWRERAENADRNWAQLVQERDAALNAASREAEASALRDEQWAEQLQERDLRVEELANQLADLEEGGSAAEAARVLRDALMEQQAADLNRMRAAAARAREALAERDAVERRAGDADGAAWRATAQMNQTKLLAAQAAQGAVGDVVAARADADRLNLELAKTLSSTTRSGVLRAR